MERVVIIVVSLVVNGFSNVRIRRKKILIL